MRSIVLILGLTGSLLLPAPAAEGGRSANGRYRVDVKATGAPVFTLMEKNSDMIREIAAVTVDADNCYHIVTLVSDEGRFAVVDTQTRKKDEDRLVRIYSSAAKEVSVLTLSSVLTAVERTALPTPGECPNHIEWFKSGSMKIEKESLVLETLAGRKVTVNLSDGKIVDAEEKKEGPDASLIQEGACPGNHVHGHFLGECRSCKKSIAGCGNGHQPNLLICGECADALAICQLCLKKK